MSSIYIIGERDSGVLKIGIAHNTVKRLNGIKIGNPHDIDILWERSIGAHARAVEQSVHLALAGVRIRGEWFKITLPEAIAAIEKSIANEPLERMRREWRDAWQARLDRHIAAVQAAEPAEIPQEKPRRFPRV